jgi:hypothetical protein
MMVLTLLTQSSRLDFGFEQAAITFWPRELLAATLSDAAFSRANADVAVKTLNNIITFFMLIPPSIKIQTLNRYEFVLAG